MELSQNGRGFGAVDDADQAPGARLSATERTSGGASTCFTIRAGSSLASSSGEGTRFQERAGLGDPDGAISVGEQAVVADFHEAGRQDVSKAEAAQKTPGSGGESSTGACFAGIVLVAEGVATVSF